eukprot:TRINITY_DN33391_c0_g1_i1.p1 TRINITY_DN33391_c0_g1~~TRINITY_DN33391_c0_g1_i1.p1  ORF type:complete len:351 (+),score=108.00 TRINITY_DN33391_c0_g1_i1:77-1054(+)
MALLSVPQVATDGQADASSARRRSARKMRSSAAAMFLAACGVVAGKQLVSNTFVSGRGASSSSSALRGASRVSLAAYEEMTMLPGLQGFKGSEYSLWTGFAVFAMSLPGVLSTIQRTGQAKYVEKTYLMPGTGAGGLEMRAIAGGCVAFFKSQNYIMEDAPTKGKIRFVGNLQGSVSQALYVTLCLAGALVALAFVLQSIWPDGPFGMGPNGFFLPVLISPAAGWYYWGRAFRKDIVEMQLEMADDYQTMTLTAIGNEETIEEMQRGVRFQSPEGKLFMLTEKDMEYQPGLFDDGYEPIIWKDEGKAEKTDGAAPKKAEKKAETA